MKCPECGSQEFCPDEHSRPLINLGGKEKYPSFNIRRYECAVCSYRFKTVEKHWQPIARQIGPPPLSRSAPHAGR